ncbi:MAG: lysine--tRNA ligase [bacterium]|nr:lysine--tRNA ligase [bacterium]
MPTLDDLRGVRIEKLNKLRSLGIDPYPSRVRRDQTIADARTMEGKRVCVVGRVMGVRGHGKIFFFDIADQSDKIQVVIKEDTCDSASFALTDLLDIGDFVSVQGLVGNTQSREVSIFAVGFQIIAKTIRPLPDQWYGLKDVEERYRKRYLDMLLNPEVKKRLLFRSRIIDAIRDFLTDREFIEVETPTLQPVYGGGFAKPFVTHHNVLDANFYLRISDEMYLKRLIVGGLEKVFEITKVFRNEGVDHDHNPEFTMFEAQIAFEDYAYGMDIIEEIIEYVALQAFGTTTFTYQSVEIDVKRPWTRLRMTDAISEYTGLNPMNWTRVAQAKAEIQALDIPEEKFKDLQKIQSLGECMAFVFEEVVEGKLIQPTIVYDYPIEISPLAKKCEDARFTQRFEMFAFGSELGNNYTELNDPLDLRKRFIEEKKREEAGFEEAHQTDDDYLEAIEHGFPPTCGIAIGIDRLVMLLTDAKSIKEVIPFPTLRPVGKGSKNKELGIKNKGSEDGTDASSPITRKEAVEFLDLHMQNVNLRRHCYAVGFAMRALAQKLGGDPDTWEVLGILHDADWEETKDAPDQHTRKTLSWLSKRGVTHGPIVHALMSHNRKHTELAQLEGIMEWTLETVDELTGFIVAVALVKPDKKLSSVSVDSILKKWKTKEFAKAVDRSQIEQCEVKLEIPLFEFIEITLKAMQEQHEELGL